MQLPLTPNTAHGVQAQDLRTFQKLNKQLVQVVDNGLRQPICSIQLRSGLSSDTLGKILKHIKHVLGCEGWTGARVRAFTCPHPASATVTCLGCRTIPYARGKILCSLSPEWDGVAPSATPSCDRPSWGPWLQGLR